MLKSDEPHEAREETENLSLIKFKSYVGVSKLWSVAVTKAFFYILKALLIQNKVLLQNRVFKK